MLPSFLSSDHCPVRHSACAARRRKANLVANKGKDRKDLYTDNWDGSEYKGSKLNVLSVILIVSILTPLFGIIFAYLSYGRLWG
jgi:hypothetical protein